MNHYAIVGTWNFRGGERGVQVLRYDPATSEMTHLGHYDSEVNAGQQYFDPNRNVLYIVDESNGRPGETAGGGYIRAYKLDPATGELRYMNESCVLMTKPSYFWLDKSGEYAMVSAHTGRESVTKVVRMPDGSLGSCVVYEDVGVALMRVNEDGSLGPVCDVALYDGITPLPNQVHAHPHSVKASPSGEIFYACDKGLDMIYSYKIDREKGKIIRMAETPMGFATAPRYSVFHPTLPVLYENNETSREIFAFRYCEKTGALEEINRVSVCEDAETVSPSDIVIHPSGQYVYAAIRSANKLVVLSVDGETGAITPVQTVDSGDGPRGITVDPDGRFLLCANTDAQEIRSFPIGEDGTLGESRPVAEVPNAANLSIIRV